jgi:Domain of unknown function (DUF4123)
MTQMDTLKFLTAKAKQHPLHMCVDLASSPIALMRLTGSTQPSGAKSLFEDVGTTDASTVSPWLVPCAEHEIKYMLTKSISLARDTPSVLWLFGPLSTEELFRRMVSRTEVAFADGTELLLRFFDPRIVAELQAVLDDKQQEDFFGLANSWCYLNRNFELCEIECGAVPDRDAFSQPLVLTDTQESGLVLASEAGQVLNETLQRWAQPLMTRAPQARFELAKVVCRLAEEFKLDGLADKVLLLMYLAEQADGFVQSTQWKTTAAKLSAGTLSMTRLLETEETAS